MSDKTVTLRVTQDRSRNGADKAQPDHHHDFFAGFALLGDEFLQAGGLSLKIFARRKFKFFP